MNKNTVKEYIPYCFYVISLLAAFSIFLFKIEDSFIAIAIVLIPYIIGAGLQVKNERTGKKISGGIQLLIIIGLFVFILFFAILMYLDVIHF